MATVKITGIRCSLPPLIVLLMASIAAPCALRAQCSPFQKLVASDGVAFDSFGFDTAVTDEEIIVASVRAAYVFRYAADSGLWIETQRIDCQHLAALAADTDLLVLGVIDSVSLGSVRLYRRDAAGQFQPEAVLLPSGGEPTFGSAVAAYGPIVAVGAAPSTPGPGTAYVFRYDGTSWTEQARLGPFDGSFGQAVSVAYNALVGTHLLAVGAPTDDDRGHGAGSVHSFELQGNTWVHQQEFWGIDTDADDSFGTDVLVLGYVAVIGAAYADVGAEQPGAAYAFFYDSTTSSWTETAKLWVAGAQTGARFGESLAKTPWGPLLLGGSRAEVSGEETGAATVFRYFGNGSWFEDQTLAPPDREPLDRFGRSVAAGNSVAVAGMPGDTNGNGAGAGSAYVLSTSELYLQAVAPEVHTGDPITITSACGDPGSAILLAAVDIAGMPGFWPLLTSVFDASEQFVLTTTVPPGLQGLDVELKTYKEGLAFGRVAESNGFVIRFR